MPFDPFLPNALAEALGPAGALDALAEHRAQAETLLEQTLVSAAPRQAAHRLAGCAGQLGMETTALAARAIERQCPDGGLLSAQDAAHLRQVFHLEWISFQAWATEQEI